MVNHLKVSVTENLANVFYYSVLLLGYRVILCNSFSTIKHTNACFLRKTYSLRTVIRLSLSSNSPFSSPVVSTGCLRRKIFKQNSDRSGCNVELFMQSSNANGTALKNERVFPTSSDSIEALEKDTTRVLKEMKNGKDDTITPAIFGESILTMTRVWDLSMWERHTSRARYFHHVTGVYSSRLSRRILPQFSVCVLWSLFSINVLVSRSLMISTHFVPSACLSMVSTFVVFILTLRSNQGLARLSEGRELWGRAFIAARDIAQLLVAYGYPRDKQKTLLAVRHLSIFAWLLKGRLRGTDDTDLIETMIPSSTARSYLNSNRKPPAAIIAHLRQYIAYLANDHALPIPVHQKIEDNLNELNYVLGMCERLAGSPIPPSYTSHTSRLLVFYLFWLPFALHGMALKKAVTVLVTAVVGYAVLGLDEISHVLEQPFRLMPLQPISCNIMLDVVDALVCKPPEMMGGEKYKAGNVYDGSNIIPEYW